VLDPRTPVLVGVGQVTNRPNPDQPAPTRPHPFALMADACRLAAADAAGSRGHRLLGRAGSLAMVGGLGWRLPNGPRWVAGELGIDPADLAVSAIGGNMPLTLLHRAAGMIALGELDVAVVCGAECFFTRRALGAQQGLGAGGDLGEPAGWPSQDPDEIPTPHLVGTNRSPVTPAELACGVTLPVDAYPLLEHSLRAARGWSPADHRARMGTRWAGFSEVAAANPYAWLPERHSPEQIVEPGPNNRMIALPYPKMCTANIFVDQSSALICCSVAAARDARVPEDRWIFPLGGAEAHDHWFLSERVALHSSPAMEIAGQRALALAGVGVDDLSAVDLYSCFPVVVEMAAAALGLDAAGSSPRPLTVTGGLTFFGGPGNNYVTHAVASLAERLRSTPSSVGLASGLGWYATKHAFAVFASRPPAHAGAPFRCDDVQRDVDALPRQAVDDDATGAVTVETYTVVYDRQTRPHHGIAVCRTPGGTRTWAAVTHPDSLAAIAERDSDFVGTAGTLGADRQLTFG
jgi:acetyl-CoA C-acetyltransferase